MAKRYEQKRHGPTVERRAARCLDPPAKKEQSVKQPSRRPTTTAKKRRTNPDEPIGFFPTDLPVPYRPILTAAERTLPIWPRLDGGHP